METKQEKRLFFASWEEEELKRLQKKREKLLFEIKDKKLRDYLSRGDSSVQILIAENNLKQLENCLTTAYQTWFQDATNGLIKEEVNKQIALLDDYANKAIEANSLFIYKRTVYRILSLLPSIALILGAAFATDPLAITLCVAISVFCLIGSFVVLGIEFSRENDNKFDKFVFFRAKEEKKLPGGFTMNENGEECTYDEQKTTTIDELLNSSNTNT